MFKTKCFICGGDDSELFLQAKETFEPTDKIFSLFRCRRCGLIFLNPAPEAEEMEAFYAQGSWAGRENRREVWYRDIMIYLELKRFKRFMGRGGRLLEVGMGAGEYLYQAQRLGIDGYGIEISEDLVNYAREVFRLRNVINSDLLSTSFADEFFDVIMFNGVFEHLYHPLETLKEVSRILKKEGILVIQVPNIDSYQFKVLGKRWFGLGIPQHLYHFTSQTLKLVLEKAGFNVFKILFYSLRNSPGHITLSLTKLNPYKLYAEEQKGNSVSLQKLLILLLNWIFTPFSLLEAWLKKGGVITVFAKKFYESS